MKSAKTTILIICALAAAWLIASEPTTQDDARWAIVMLFSKAAGLGLGYLAYLAYKSLKTEDIES